MSAVGEEHGVVEDVRQGSEPDDPRTEGAARSQAHSEHQSGEGDGQDDQVRAARIARSHGRIAEDAWDEDADRRGDQGHHGQGTRQPVGQS